MDCCQPDAVPDHRPGDLNGSQVGGLGLSGQVGEQADFQLKNSAKWSETEESDWFQQPIVHQSGKQKYD